MKAVIQRVSEASVQINGEMKDAIGIGLLVFVGIGQDDESEDVNWLAKKITDLRIFADREDKMNLNLSDVGGRILLISQFTLHAKTKKGTRPSFIRAARPEQAIPLYEDMKVAFQVITGHPTACGDFGADMKVSLVNDGPVTILIDTKDKA